MSTCLVGAQNFRRSFEYGPWVNLQFSRANFAFEMSTGHNFETADHLNFACQFTFQLQVARRDMRIDLRIGPNDQKITSLDLATETTVDFNR